MQSTNSSMNFPLQLEGVLSQTGRENRVLCCLLAFTEVRRPSFLTRPARPPGVFFRQLCAANRSIEAGWSSRAALENCHRHLVKMTAMAYLCQMCQAGSPFRISYAGSQQNSVLHGRVSCSARTSASTHHGLGTRCRFHAFADVLSIIWFCLLCPTIGKMNSVLKVHASFWSNSWKV